MKLGIVAIPSKKQKTDAPAQFAALARYAFEQGLDTEFFTVYPSDSDLAAFLDTNLSKVDALIFFGGDVLLKESLGIADGESVGQINSTVVAVLDIDAPWEQGFEAFVLDKLVSETKTVYETVRIKTFGLSEQDAREKLRDLMGGRRKYEIILEPSTMECDVLIRYSNKMTKFDFDHIIQTCALRLGDNIYGMGETNLQISIISELIASNKKIAIAESFTGGRVVSALLSVPGASAVVAEGIVAYSDEAKIHRLDVDRREITKKSAVSHEVAYMMATGLFSHNPDIDYVVSTTGYAGPTGEDVGLCFIASGDSRGIHLRKYRFSGTREEITEQGVKCALNDILMLVRKPD